MASLNSIDPIGSVKCKALTRTLREWRAISLAHTWKGKHSKASCPRQKAPHPASHGTSLNGGRTPERRETGRGPERGFVRCPLLFSHEVSWSTMELETKVPAPERLSR